MPMYEREREGKGNLIHSGGLLQKRNRSREGLHEVPERRRVGVEIAPDVRLGICGAERSAGCGWGASETFFQLRSVLGRMGRRQDGYCTRTICSSCEALSQKVTANMQHVGMTQFAIMGVLLANWKTSIKDFIYTGR